MAEKKDKKQEVQEQRKEVEDKQKDQVMRVIAGHNDTFEENYKFKELDLEFTIKLKFPTMIEQARISSETEREFQGLSGIMNQNFTKAVWMAKIIKYQQQKYEGDKEAIYIPKDLENPEETYNPLILSTIADDFQEWMNSFRY